MNKSIFKNNNVVSLGSISSQKDFKNKARININPPLLYDRCYCCGRHISEKPVVFRQRDNLFNSIGGFIHAIFSW